MRSMTWQEVWVRRLARHALLAPRPKERLVEVVGSVCGIHAQVMSAAEISIGIRLAGATRQDVRDALWQRRGLVKTYGPRGTIHLFPADEAALWSAALRAHPAPGEERRLAAAGLESARLEAIVAAIGEALDGCTLTRDELGRAVASRLGSWTSGAVGPAFGGQLARWQMAIGSAASAGVLCFGPDRGAKVTFVRADQWLGVWPEVDADAAFGEAFRRYLSAYGPATHREFAQWFGTSAGAALALTHELAAELEMVDVEGHQAWLLASEASEPWPVVRDAIRLLPHFDCYLLGCHPRDRLVAPECSARVLTRGAIGNLPVLVLDGVVAGLWQQRRAGQRLEIRVEPFLPLTATQRAELEEAVARLGELAEAATVLSLDTVVARPHL